MHILKTKTAATIFLATMVFLSGGTAAQEFVASVHYKILPQAQPVQTGDKIEVAEVFWYRCPHCYNLQPHLKSWLKRKPETAELVHIPAVLNERWAKDARLYYTIAATNYELHDKIFAAIHAKNKNLSTPEQIKNWANKNGGDGDAIIKAFDSFSVGGKVQFAKVMSRKYGITGTPSIVVDGKYRTSVSLAGDVNKLFQVVDFLIAKAASNRN